MIKEVCTISVCYKCNFFGGLRDNKPSLSMNGKDYYPIECRSEECPAGDPGLIGDPIPPKGDE